MSMCNKKFGMLLLFIISIAFLSSCTHGMTMGKDFNSSLRNEIILGTTDKDWILRMLGNAEKTETASVKGQTHELLTYYYQVLEPTHLWLAPKPWVIRMLLIELSLDVVRGYFFLSAFPQDITIFDESVISRIKVGKTRKSDIVNLLGNPHGKSLLPSMRVSSEIEGVESAVEVWLYRSSFYDAKKDECCYSYKRMDIFLMQMGLS